MVCAEFSTGPASSRDGSPAPDSPCPAKSSRLGARASRIARSGFGPLPRQLASRRAEPCFTTRVASADNCEYGIDRQPVRGADMSVGDIDTVDHADLSGPRDWSPDISPSGSVIAGIHHARPHSRTDPLPASAPAATRRAAVSGWGPLFAHSKGDQPVPPSSLRFGSAPWANNSRTVPACPQHAAAHNAVPSAPTPLLSTSGDAPAKRSRPTITASPFTAAA